MINYNLYKTFYYVAKEGNITKASEKLYISQPAVSESIKDLEEQLGQKVFIRKNKGVDLTPFGKILFDKVKNIIVDLDNIENLGQKFNKLMLGQLRIGATSANFTQILVKSLTSFAKKYPDLNIIMKKNEREVLINELNSRDLDIAFVDYFDGCEKDFDVIKEYDICYNLIGNKKFKEKYNTANVEISQFPMNDLVLPSKNNKSRDFIEEYFKKFNISLESRYELDNYKLLYEFVKTGLGIGFVNTDFYSEKIKNHEVEIIFPEFSLPARRLVCLVKKGSRDNYLKEFIEIIK